MDLLAGDWPFIRRRQRQLGRGDKESNIGRVSGARWGRAGPLASIELSGAGTRPLYRPADTPSPPPGSVWPTFSLFSHILGKDGVQPCCPPRTPGRPVPRGLVCSPLEENIDGREEQTCCGRGQERREGVGWLGSQVDD